MNLKYYENLLSEETLKDNLIFTSIFNTVFENTKETMIDRVKSFLCDNKIVEGEFVLLESENFKQLRKRKYGEKGQTNIFFSTIFWLIEAGCLCEEDYKVILLARDVRNNYAHNLFDVLSKGVSEQEIELLIKLLTISSKFDNWWIVQIELPISGEFIKKDNDNIDISNCFSMQQYFINAIVELVLMHKGQEKYKEFLNELHKASQNITKDR